MNINTMHIGIDLNLQAINSNVFGKLEHEEKDYWLNNTTEELIKAVLLNEENTVFSLLTYSNIRSYYEALQVYIRKLQLGITEQLGDGYVYGILPTDITTGTITSGVLYHGIKYEIVVVGTMTTNLADFGYPKNPPIVGETFICDITQQTGTSIDIVNGEEYRIINAHDGVATGDFTTVGAPNNLPGTEFTATSSATITGGASTVIQNLSDTPVWAGATLRPIYNRGFYLPIDSTTDVSKGDIITSGALTIGKKYIVDTTGTTTLVPAGGVATPDVGYMFTCTSNSTITWQGGTKLYPIENVGNRLIKTQDIRLTLDNSFGSMKTSPISTYVNNRLHVYHQNKFSIERIYIDYIIKPITVDWNTETDSDLPESLHYKLVSLTAERIAAVSNAPNYPALDKENKETVQ